MTRIAVATRDYTTTRTHTVTYLTEVIVGALSDIVATLEMDTSRLDLEDLERAIGIWLGEGSLERVVLECYTPKDDQAHAVFEFPVEYSAAGADAQFTADRASLAAYRAKLRRVPRDCTYRVVVRHRSDLPHAEVEGWGPCTLRSTDGMRSRVFGTLANAPGGTVSFQHRYRP